MKYFISKKLLLIVSLFLTLISVKNLYAKSQISNRPKKLSGTIIVPDKFLRQWDPVTIFFDKAVGKEGPLDNPDKFIKFMPGHPGAFRFLDSKTLQFSPADPWPPLTDFTWKVNNKKFKITTLMSVPVSTLPSNNQEGLLPVESITLTFKTPIPEKELKRMIAIKLKPLPGITEENALWLTSDDFKIKTIERKSLSDNTTYILNLNEPISYGTRAEIHLKLSLNESSNKSFTKITFETDKPFTITKAGCSGKSYPFTPEGTNYSDNKALNCKEQTKEIFVRFSANPKVSDPINWRNLVRISPSIDNLSYSLSYDMLYIKGNFSRGTLYKLTLVPTPVKDKKERLLTLVNKNSLFFYFTEKSPYLNINTADAILERYGPQSIPISGRGHEKIDLRIHKIDPLDRSFWPYPTIPISIDESKRPLGPGEKPKKHIDTSEIYPSEISRHISILGSVVILKQFIFLPFFAANS